MGIMGVAQLGKYLLYKNQELSLILELSLKKVRHSGWHLLVLQC